MSKGKLTRKQLRFVEEYCIDWNASRAARAAGYSPKTAFRSGQENMQRPAILEAIQKKSEEISLKADISAEWVRRNLKELHDVCAESNEPQDRSTRARVLGQSAKVLGMEKSSHDVNVKSRIIFNAKK